MLRPDLGSRAGKIYRTPLTQFSNGWMFDEIAGKKKELFAVLGVEAPSVGQTVAEGASDGEVPTDDSIYILPEEVDGIEEL